MEAYGCRVRWKKGLVWKWQAIDSQSIAAPVKGEKIGKNPTDRAKNGTKRHIYVDANGIPVGAVLSGANEHDVTMYQNCLASCVVRRPSSKKEKQHICLDKAYDSEEVRRYLGRKFIVHIPERNNRKQEKKTRRIQGRRKARRWVVERTGAWHNKFRRLKTRYEQRAENYLAFVMFASALICFRNI
jgi:putative transposase